MIRRRKPIARSTKPLKRTEIKRSPLATPLRGARPKRIAARSEKTLAKLPERARVIDAAWDRDGGRCRARDLVPQIVCGGRLDPHERIPRSCWPGGELVLDNVMLICRRHHEWVDVHPSDAHVLGLHGYSHERLRVV